MAVIRTERRLNRRDALGALAGAAAAMAFPALAQAVYPSRPIRMVLGFSAGGPTDVVARIIANKLNQVLGQPVVVDNRPGANAVLAADVVAKAPADGHTLLYNTSSFALAAALSSRLPYDPARDFRGVTLTAAAPTVLIVHPSINARTPEEFVDELKRHPGKYNYGSAGTGTITHVIPVQLLQASGLSATHIPYKGSAPALVDLAGGQIQFAVDAMSSALPFIRDGRVRAIAVTSKQRLPTLPGIPTAGERWIPGYEASAWQGLMVHSATPAAIVGQLNQALIQVLAQADVQKQLADLGTDTGTSTPEQYDQFVKREIARWTQVAKEARLQTE